MNNTFELLKTQIEEKSKDYPIKSIVHCGSSAKETSLDNSDVDVFIRFDLDYDFEKFPDYIKYLAQAIFNNTNIIKHGKFPYIETDINGIKINIVVCYHTESIAEIKSPTDRSPHHVTWVNENLSKEQKEDVKKLKEFLKINNLYGADDTINGFSGYLCEVLIHKYNDFNGVINVFAHTEESDINKPPYYITDPIDVKRKLSAAVSNRSWSRLILTCREHLGYNPPQTADINIDELKNTLDEHVILLLQEYEDIAKVRKETKKAVKILRKAGFTVYDYNSKPRLSIILVENKTLSNIYVKHKIISIVSKGAHNNIGKINGADTLKIIINDDFTISALKRRERLTVSDLLKEYTIIPVEFDDYGYKKYLAELNIL